MIATSIVVPEVLHVQVAGRDRRARARDAGASRAARRAARARARRDGDGARRRCTSRRAERAAAVLFGGSLAEAAVEDILMVFDDAPSISIERASLESGIGAADLAVRAGLAASKGEAGRYQAGRSLCERSASHRGARAGHDGGCDRPIGDCAAERPARTAHRQDGGVGGVLDRVRRVPYHRRSL